jgi:serine/threonine protein phosphatase PrpC
MVEPGTTFLLCSDGVTRHIDDAEIGGLLANGNPASICDRSKRSAIPAELKTISLRS